jgi:hypothetical protein
MSAVIDAQVLIVGGGRSSMLRKGELSARFVEVVQTCAAVWTLGGEMKS